jgi:hypothetical protein
VQPGRDGAHTNKRHQNMTTLTTKITPIEVWLSQPHREVTCRIVFPGGTTMAVGVVSPSFEGAEQELTAWLTEHGYQPAGRWRTDDNGRQTVRIFRHPGRPAPALFPALRPGTPKGPRPGPNLASPRGPARPVASPARRLVARDTAAGDGRESALAAAEAGLRAWAQSYARRDDVIREADAAGISLQRIHQITGIARTAILRILGSPPKPARLIPR